MDRFDRWVSDTARRLSRGTSRRSFLARVGRLGLLGVLGTGAAAVPLLPVSRALGQTGKRLPAPGEPSLDTPEGNPDDCAYWRYCAVDGFLSSCCGGTNRSCPPGTEMSPVTWIGTCRNPNDGKDYVISYNDCCGKDACGRCFCRRNEGDRPVYLAGKSNDINWCMGQVGIVYNSTVALVLGVATEAEDGK